MKFEDHDWYVIQTEDGDTYVFTKLETAERCQRFYRNEHNMEVTILAGMDGQTI